MAQELPDAPWAQDLPDAPWAAKPAEPEPVPPSFLHRLATGLMVGGAADASPEELRQKGFEDFNYPANVVQAFKGGFDRANKAKAAIQGGATGMAKLGAEWDEMMGGVEQLASPLTAAFQLAGGAVEKASGGLLTSESVQDALMLSDGAPARISRVRNGVEQVIGDLPKDQDFKVGAKVLGAPEADQNLRDLWQERGIHPAEAVHDAQSDALLKGDLTRKNLEPPDRSDIPPVQGTPAPEGTPRTELAKTGEPHIDRILDSEPTKQVIDSPVVDREHTVPYTAGGSVPLDDPTFFIDKRFPHSFSIDGVTFDPADPFAVHENVEQHVMELLTKGGRDTAPDAALDPTLDRVRAMGSPMDIAMEAAKDPEAVHNKIDEIVTGIRQAERELRQRHGVKKTEDLEDAPLNKKESDFLFYGKDHTDVEYWRDLQKQLQPVENLREAAKEIAYELKRLPKDPSSLSGGDEMVVVRLQTLFSEVHRLGGDLGAVIKEAGARYGARFDDPEDAEFMVQGAAARLRSLFDEQKKQLALPAPGPAAMDAQTAYRVAHFEFAEKAEGAWYAAHGIDQAKAEAAYAPYMAEIQKATDANPPPNLYKRPYPHDDPSAAQHEPIAEPKPSKDEIARAKAILDSQEAGGALRAGGADVTRDMPDLATQPPRPAGSLMMAAKAAADKLFDIGRDAQMLVAPMARGTRDSMAAAKDFANSMRRNRWEWSRVDSDIAKRFSPEQRKRMWDAADEESVARQLGESREHQGLVTLEPEERAAVEQLQTRAQLAWARARDMGMVDGEGLPAYTPRMVINAASAVSGDAAIPLNGLGANLRTRTAQMMRRKYMTAEETEAAAKARLGDDATIARDIRALPLATAKLEDAVAGRSLIDNIKAIGRQTGSETVADGFRPDSSWFTLDHPSFRTYRPRMEEVDGAARAAKDQDGNTIFDQVPLYVRGDFEGPLRAVLNVRKGAQTYSGMAYGSMMALKGKTMSLIMNSPLIHNAVEWGRALPAMPGKVATFKVYFEGNRAKNDVATMKEAIDGGLVPIGHRFFNQDITSIMEEPNLTPGRSWTSQVLGFVPGLFDEGAGTAVKAAIDKAGNFWHNTLLWDRVADLQMGLYTNFRDDLLAKGVDGQTAARAAAHWANRYAGALPKEAMSDAATKTANMLLFSRSFTMGNLGVLKDMLTGLPKDVMAQIERDMGQIDPAAAGYVKGLARRKAMAVVALDMGLFYAGNSVLQSALNVMKGDNTLDQEMHGYAQRLSTALTETKEHPLKLLQPFNFLQSLSSTSANEPGKEGRVKVGHAKDGTAIYARNPAGKIGEEFLGYMTGPLDMMRRKLGTLARPAWQVMNNDAGFGRKIYDPDADTPAKYLRNLGAIAEHIAGSQLPEGQIGAFSDLVKGEGDAKVNAAQALGPVAGVTFAKGAPGGEAVGELYHARTEHNYAVDQALPDIRRQIQRGDEQGARDRMTELGVPRGLQNFYVRTSANPATRLSGKTLRDFYQFATPEQKARMENAR